MTSNLLPLEYDVWAEHSHPALDFVRHLGPRVKIYADENKEHDEGSEEAPGHDLKDSYVHDCCIGGMIAHRHHNKLLE